MDWCIETAMRSAIDVAEREVLDHLTRHAEHEELVELAAPIVHQALSDTQGMGTCWLAVEWEDAVARLTIRGLAPGDWPQPGPSGRGLEPMAPGVALAHQAVPELARCATPGATTIALGVVRPPEGPAPGWPALPALPEVTHDSDYTKGFLISLSLRLPRDRLSVPVVRHLTHHALDEVGVVGGVADDVELALAEACANVLTHSGPGDVYDVSISIGPEACDIRVTDVGRGFDHASLKHEMARTDSESGRGVALMHALMDQVRFTSEPEQGTIVHLVKRLEFDDSAPTRQLMLASLGDEPTA